MRCDEASLIAAQAAQLDGTTCTSLSHASAKSFVLDTSQNPQTLYVTYIDGANNVFVRSTGSSLG